MTSIMCHKVSNVDAEDSIEDETGMDFITPTDENIRPDHPSKNSKFDFFA